ncbi:putative hydratase/decarboxylase 4-oxalocrotonate decarboxylase [Sulfitobacter noctilucicola]|uniref:2-keto-4-pentenoate hydratase n=1 Tax=Sulfitobacter noctilucicola TaxID=1342301 RepID=A0A7W6Q3U4_9RHOB|nr:fumarylacetoacetate hydrolase family protein [Sulfitobacter noctilucicola]KIN64257.1 putative hydratase/decarboxylase 4-oxalocrotonate decarboxylase [Sulfitobacter noctilucicola]MBB4174575.1 2-keto-4-pentenoate hydratase [Sulfitobacter noctilucicola]
MSDAITVIAHARSGIGTYDLSVLPDTLAGAYDFQDGLAAAVGKAGGFKMAVNGAPQMAHFGVDEPVWARIFADQVHASGVTLPRSGFDAVSVEPEIAAILGAGVEKLTGAVDRDTALTLIDRFHPAIELIDQRGLSVPQLTLPQAVALNVFNAGCVLGPDHIAPADLDLEAMHVTIHDDSALVGEATNNAPQHPVDAVMWLVNQLTVRGVKPQAGMVVLCGTHLPLRTLDASVGRVDVRMSGLGEVSFSLV